MDSYLRGVINYTTEEAWLKERTKWLTSSDIPCLFGVGYKTYEELIYDKRNGTQGILPQTEEMSWGLALEPAIAGKFAKDNGWDIRKKSEFIILHEHRVASSFDYEVSYETQDDKGEAYIAKEILEIKVVSEWKYKKDWITTGFEIESTPYIELQLQNELLVSGLNVGYIGACIGGSKGVLLRREANPKIHKAILQKAEKFWREVDEEK